MTRIDTVSIALDADTNNFMNGMREAGQLVQKQSGSMVSSIGNITQSFFYATQAVHTIVATGQQIYGFGRAVFDLGANAEETASKFSATLGPATELAQAFLEDFAITAGLTVTEGRDLIATTAGIAMGFGMGQTEAAAFSEEVLRLAGDMTSYTNVPIEETSRAIQSALTGERESLKNLGVVINEADVQKKALMMTGKENAKALTAEEKATASLALITERAAYMVGNLEMTKDSAANTARRLGAELRQAKEIIARALTPALSEVMNAIGDLVGGEGFEGMINKIVASRDQIAAWAVVSVNVVGAATTTIVESLKIMGDSFQVFSNAMKAYLAPLRGDLGGAVDAFSEMRSGLLQTVESLKKIGASFGNTRGAIVDAMNTGLAEIEEFIRGINEADQQVIDMTNSVETSGVQIEDFATRLKKLGDETQVTNEMLGNLPYHAQQAANGIQRLLDKSNALGSGFRRMGQEWVNSSGQLVRDGRIVSALEQAEFAAKQFGNQIVESVDNAQPVLAVLTSNFGAVGDAIDIGIDLLKQFGEQLSAGANKTDALASAIQGISAGGFAFLLDQTIGLITNMFAARSRARAEAERLHNSLLENREALDRNTDVQMRSLTGGFGGATLTSIMDILGRVTAARAEFEAGLGDDVQGAAFDFMGMLRTLLGEAGLSMEDLESIASALGIEFENSTVFIEMLGKRINELIGNQLNSFANQLDNLQDMFRLRGVSAQDQVRDMLAFLTDAVGPEIDAILESLLTAEPEEVGNIIADLIQGLRDGNSDLIGALGDVPIDEFISVLMELFQMFGEIGGALPPETERTDPGTPPGPDDTGTGTGEGTSTPRAFADMLNEMLATIGLTVGPAIDDVLASLTPENAEEALMNLLEQIRAGEEVARDLFGISVEEFEGMIGTILELMAAAGSAFANEFDPSKQIDEAGEAANVAANDLIASLMASVGDPIDEILAGLTGYNAEELLASLREQIAAGGDLAAQLGDLEPDAFMSMIDELLQLILTAGDDFEQLALPDLPGDEGTNRRVSKADEQFAQMFELHRVGYDSISQRLGVLEQNVDLLISTNRNGFEDVTVAVRSA